MTVEILHLQHQESRAELWELTARHYADQVSSLRRLVRFLGPHRQFGDISASDLQNYKEKLQNDGAGLAVDPF
jgi:hypothetical protein